MCFRLFCPAKIHFNVKIDSFLTFMLIKFLVQTLNCNFVYHSRTLKCPKKAAELRATILIESNNLPNKIQ